MNRLLLLFFLPLSLWAQPDLIPQPAVVQPQRGAFVFRPGLRLWASPACSAEQDLLNAYFRRVGLPPLTNTTRARQADVVLQLDTTRREALGAEGYELLVSSRQINLTGATAAGVFYGLQTLRQLLPNCPAGNKGALMLRLSAFLIRDKPRFRWRSVMLKVESYNGDTTSLFRLLDRLARLKFNQLYWQSGDKLSGEQFGQIRQYGARQHLEVTLLDTTGLRMDSVWVRSAEGATGTQVPVRFWKGDSRKMLEWTRLGQPLVYARESETDLSRSLNDLPLDRVYLLEPIPEQLPENLRPYVLGVNYTLRLKGADIVDAAQLFPRLAAAAEVNWTFAQNKAYKRFRRSLSILEVNADQP